jgi:hypothetical protein
MSVSRQRKRGGGKEKATHKSLIPPIARRHNIPPHLLPPHPLPQHPRLLLLGILQRLLLRAHLLLLRTNGRFNAIAVILAALVHAVPGRDDRRPRRARWVRGERVHLEGRAWVEVEREVRAAAAAAVVVVGVVPGSGGRRRDGRRARAVPAAVRERD